MCKQTPNTAVLAEYANVRGEIQQLNGQVFAILSSSIAADIAVLGWLSAKDAPYDYFLLPTFGILLLLAGSVILLNRNRLGHRLALFQKYFIESRVPDICWSRVYFEYRKREKGQATGGWSKALLTALGERLAESGAYVLLGLSVVNVIVSALIGLAPCLSGSSTDIDWSQVVNLLLAILLVYLEWCFCRKLTNYDVIENMMKSIAQDSGLPSV